MKDYINNLTALRGIAAIMIVLLHFHLWYGAIVPESVNPFMDKLYLMVDWFFMLSGFVMCYVYQDVFSQSLKRHELRRFILLRLARIYPLHFVTLMAHIILWGLHVYTNTFESLDFMRKYTYQAAAIPAQLFFIDGIGLFDFAIWNTPAWSLSAEWWSYVLFPFVLFLVSRIGKLSMIVLPVVILSLWCLLEFKLAATQPFVMFPADPNKTGLNLIWHWGVLRGITGFVAGMFLFQLYQKQIFKKLIANGLALIGLFVLTIVSMTLAWWDTFSVCLLSLIVLSCAYGSKNINATLNGLVLQKLGDWSFSIYMWHHVVFNTFTSIFILQSISLDESKLRLFGSEPIYDNLVAMVIYMTIILFVGRMSYEYIENPTRRFFRKVIEKQPQRPIEQVQVKN